MFNKKAIAPYVSIVMLLLVSISAFNVMYTWFLNEESEAEIFLNAENIKRVLEVIRVEGDTLYVDNDGDINITLKDLMIGGIDCSLSNVTLVSGLNEIDIGTCTSGLDADEVYSVALVTNAGVVAESEYLFGTFIGGFIFNFEIGTCNFAEGYVKVFGLSGINNSHLENSTSSLYTYNGCAKHLDYTLGVANVGNFINLGYLINSNNSMFFTSTSSPLVAVSDWHNLSLSSSGGVFDLNITSESLIAENYSCLGKFDRDNTYGAHFGDCYSAYNTTIWAKLS